MRKKIPSLFIGAFLLLLVLIGLYNVPWIHDRLAWRLEDLQTKLYYFFNPPSQVVFSPIQQGQVTFTPLPPATATPTPPPAPGFTPTPEFTPTPTPTPLPQTVILENVVFVDQMNRWNYCGPANLTMALQYWGWKGLPGKTMALRDQVGVILKPGPNDPALNFIERSQTDVNVMPYEMVDFVNDYTEFRALYRYGGTVDLLKRLIAAGFPVITEKGVYQVLPPTYTPQWAGHYAFTTGYDDTTGEFIYQDSYTPDKNIPYEKQGKNQRVSYEKYVSGWRAFNYVFIVVYPPDRQAELFQALGPWLDQNWAARNALEIAQRETETLTGLDQFFAWFNLGTSYGLLTEYGLGALAYDKAFELYNALPENERPYRIMWYQTGPYKAYYYTSRFQDVINLANATERTLFRHRVLEETLYWRALAKAALGDYEGAYADMRKAVYYNPNFTAGLQKLAEWGISP